MFGRVAHLGLAGDENCDTAIDMRALSAFDMLLALLRNDRRFDVGPASPATSKSSSSPCSKLPYISHKLPSSASVPPCRSGVELNRVSVLPSSGDNLGTYWSDCENPRLSLSLFVTTLLLSSGALPASPRANDDRPQQMGTTNLIGPQCEWYDTHGRALICGAPSRRGKGRVRTHPMLVPTHSRPRLASMYDVQIVLEMSPTVPLPAKVEINHCLITLARLIQINPFVYSLIKMGLKDPIIYPESIFRYSP